MPASASVPPLVLNNKRHEQDARASIKKLTGRSSRALLDVEILLSTNRSLLWSFFKFGNVEFYKYIAPLELCLMWKYRFLQTGRSYGAFLGFKMLNSTNTSLPWSFAIGISFFLLTGCHSLAFCYRKKWKSIQNNYSSTFVIPEESKQSETP